VWGLYTSEAAVEGMGTAGAFSSAPNGVVTSYCKCGRSCTSVSKFNTYMPGRSPAMTWAAVVQVYPGRLATWPRRRAPIGRG